MSTSTATYERNSKTRRNRWRRYYYARCQDIFIESPRKLADFVVNNSLDYITPVRQPPEAKEVENLYKELWDETGRADPPIPNGSTSGGLIHEYFPPVVAEEINERLKKIRNESSVGPDGLEKKHLQIPGLPIVLALSFIISFYTSHYPENWRMNRTTLTPKPNKDLDKAENWRPITISPILAIMFSSILDKSIRRGIVQNIRQKGFTSDNGCKINVDIFNATLERCKKGQGVVYTIVDISKAFDTVPHSAIRPCLARKGTWTPITDLILNMCKGSKTEIKTKNGTGVEIEVSRGVKQGDPLSPLIFNLCLEPLLEAFERSTEGINISNNYKIPILAFANDIVLLGRDQKEAQRQLAMVQEYLEGLGTSISGDKSQTFQVVSKRDTWYVRGPEIELTNKRIPYIAPEDTFRYLLAKIGPCREMNCGIIVPEIVSTIKRTKKLSLKPGQKMKLLQKYILPRYIYNLLVSPLSERVLKLLESEIRHEVKGILHLTPSTSVGLFYTSKNNGGLGLPRFEHLVKLGTLKNALKMNRSEHRVEAQEDCQLFKN